MNAVGISDKGLVRSNNEDSIFLNQELFYGLPNLFIVADGMGGHKAGEVASEQAVTKFKLYCQENEFVKEDLLDFLIGGTSFANDEVFKLSESTEEYQGMGTTFSACVLLDEKLYIAHIGDSRIYVINDKHMHQVTVDHTFVYEMVKQGQLTEEEAKTHPKRNMLTRVLGIEPNIIVDGNIVELKEYDKIMLCSDGLTNVLQKNEIYEILKCKEDNGVIVNKLIEAANNNGGIDNISVILLNAR